MACDISTWEIDAVLVKCKIDKLTAIFKETQLHAVHNVWETSKLVSTGNWYYRVQKDLCSNLKSMVKQPNFHH